MAEAQDIRSFSIQISNLSDALKNIEEAYQDPRLNEEGRRSVVEKQIAAARSCLRPLLDACNPEGLS
jgi:hypothetical protein